MQTNPTNSLSATAAPQQPTAFLWKDVIRVGRYRHPARRFTVRVDHRRLDHWARTFLRMKANGVRVHIPADHSDAAADNRGYVLRLVRVCDRLMALCEFIGADAVRDAARNQVSIGVAPTFIDGKGRVYHDAIVHVALTPVPVVPGQGSFIPAGTFSASVARGGHASRLAAAASGAAPAGVLTLAARGFAFAAAHISKRRAAMAHTMLPCSEETLSALHDLVPGLAGVPHEQKLDHLLSHIQSFSAPGEASNPAGEAAAADENAAQLSLAPLEPAVQQALVDAVKVKRDLCVTRGALTPGVADALLTHLVPSGEDGPLISLSRGGPAWPATLALSVFTALADNRPPALGQRTGSQARPLTRAVPGESAPQGPPLYEKMAAMADGKRVEL